MSVLARIRLVALAALCASSTSAVVAADAHAVSVRFGRPVVVAPGFLSGLAVNARGEALALLMPNGAVRVASRGAKGRWRRPVTLQRVRCTRTAASAVAMNARGDAAALWTRGCDEYRVPPLVVSTRSADRRWSAPRAIGRTIGATALGLTRRGVAIAAWEEGGLRVASGHAGRWSSARRLTTSKGWHGFAFDVAASGRAAAVWYERSGRIDVSRRSPTGRWSSAEPIPGLAVAPEAVPWLDVAVADNGRLLVAQGTMNPNGPNVVQVVGYEQADGWSPPRTLTTMRDQPGLLSVDMNDRGEAVVGWSQYLRAPRRPSRYGGYVDGHSEVFVATRSAQAWSATRRLDTSTLDASAVMGVGAVAITARGALFATWEISANPRGWSLGIEAATGSISGGWRRPVTVDGPDRRRVGNRTRLAVADGPHAMIGWTDPPGAQVSALR